MLSEGVKDRQEHDEMRKAICANFGEVSQTVKQIHETFQTTTRSWSNQKQVKQIFRDRFDKSVDVQARLLPDDVIDMIGEYVPEMTLQLIAEEYNTQLVDPKERQSKLVQYLIEMDIFLNSYCAKVAAQESRQGWKPRAAAATRFDRIVKIERISASPLPLHCLKEYVEENIKKVLQPSDTYLEVYDEQGYNGCKIIYVIMLLAARYLYSPDFFTRDPTYTVTFCSTYLLEHFMVRYRVKNFPIQIQIAACNFEKLKGMIHQLGAADPLNQQMVNGWVPLMNATDKCFAVLQDESQAHLWDEHLDCIFQACEGFTRWFTFLYNTAMGVRFPYNPLEDGAIL